MDINIFDNISKLSIATAEKTIDIIRSLEKSQCKINLAVSGGSTPRSFYSLLSNEPYVSLIPWEILHFFWCDERCVDFSSSESNYGQFSNLLIDRVNIPSENIHPMNCSNDPEPGVRNYIEVLSKNASSGYDFPIFDIAFLGLGDDGHTASLFPGKISESEVLTPVISTVAQYQNRPSQRITLTPKILNKSKNIFFLVSGNNKASILAKVLNGPKFLNKYPAQRIQPDKGRIYWMVDKDAACHINFE